MTDAEQIVFTALAKLIGIEGTRKLLPQSLITKLSKSTGLVQTEVRKGLAGLAKQRLIVGVNAAGEPKQLVGWIEASIQPVPTYIRVMQTVIDELEGMLTYKEQTGLLRISYIFKDIEKSTLIGIIQAALTLREHSDGNNINQEDRFILSAKRFLSSSKIIDRIGKLLELLSITLPNDKPCYYALTAGSNLPKTILFIENPRVFSYFANHANTYETLLISCYGYGLTFANFGELLKANHVIVCPTDHNPRVNLSEAIENAKCLYWGDLDYEGIQIFEKLQSTIPKLELSGIYQEMICMLEAQKGHPYTSLFGKEKQMPTKCRTPIGQYIMTLLERYQAGIDQEALCDETSLKLLFNVYLQPEQ